MIYMTKNVVVYARVIYERLINFRAQKVAQNTKTN